MLINVETLITCKQNCPYMQISRYSEDGKPHFKCDYIGLCKRLDKKGTSINIELPRVVKSFSDIAKRISEMLK